jgi:anti-anti-sigma regulatory factor
MKIINTRYVYKETEVVNKRLHRKLSSKQKKKRRNILKTTGFLEELGHLTLYCPANLNVYKPREAKESLEFLRNISTKAAQAGKVTLDFSRLTRISAAGVVMLLSKCQVAFQGKTNSVKLVLSHNDRMNRALSEVGFFDLLDKKVPQTKNYPDLTYIRSRSGYMADTSVVEELLDELHERLPKVARQLTGAISEAINNSVEHAYSHIDHHMLSQKGRWWSLGQVIDNKLAILICDLGQGIPVTFPKKVAPGIFVNLIESVGGSVNNDADIIRVATIGGESRTLKGHRGKGLKEIIETVELVPNSYIYIHSNFGAYSNKNVNGKLLGNTRGFPVSISGTLIEWIIPLGEEA